MKVAEMCGMDVFISPMVPPGKVIIATDLGARSAFMASTTFLRFRYPRSPIFATRTRDMQAYERALARSRREVRNVVYRSPTPGAGRES